MKRSKLTVKEMVDLYTVKELSLREIGKLAGVSGQTVHFHLKRAGVRFRRTGGGKRIAKKRFKDLYLKERLTIRDIAARVNFCSTTVSREIDRHGIAKRPSSSYTVKYPELRELQVGESIEFPKPKGSIPHMSFYRMAQKANIRVSVRMINEQSARVTRIS